MSNNNKLGQYFTTNNELKDKVYSFIMNKPKNILEPSIGQGDLVDYVSKKLNNIKFDMYEIDKDIKLLDEMTKKIGVNAENTENNGKIGKIIYGDFMIQEISKKYTTIIGNPPYIRTKKGNLYIDFTNKCYNLLETNGELIFIVPSDFLKLTSASKLLNEMMINGTFTHIFHPHNENLFENAAIDIIIFRYCKNSALEKKVLYNDNIMHITNSSGLITFSEEENVNNIMFKDKFDIYVGIVSGKEDVYKNAEFGNIEVLNGKGKKEKYIYIEKYPCDNEDINNYLLENKDVLLERGIRKFNNNNWFEWGAPRNISSIRANIGKDCIYVYNLTRQDNVAFAGKVEYFGGSLIMLKPKADCNFNESKLNTIVEYLNSNTFKKNFIFSGRFKMGHRQISNSYIPEELL
jgi:adenine-specific DNA-methyltransferase